MRPRRLFLLALVLALAAVPGARADYDPLGSGTTKLGLDKGFLALMKANGVKLSAVAPARLEGRSLSFPVSGGKFDPTAARGTIEHDGALLFKAKGGSIPLKALQLKTTQRRAPFSVKAGGGQLKLAAAGSLAVAREGFGDRIAVRKLSLSAKVATRLGKKLHLKGVFKEGLPLGSSTTRALPRTITVLPKGSVSLTLDPAISAKLGSLFVAVNPIFPAEHPGPFTLAILGGQIAPDGSTGTLQTQGSLEALQLGGGQVFWAEPWLDFATKSFSAEIEAQPSPPYAGKTGRGTVASIVPPAAVADPAARTVSVAGASLSLDPATAATFNEVFAKPQGKSGVFAAGEALGTIGFTAVGQ